MSLRIALFYQSLVSDWNHGNAHFLRGIASELQARGHQLRIFEPEDSWSRTNLIREYGPQAIERFHLAFPHLKSQMYSVDNLRVDEWLDGVDLTIVHEWNDPRLISRVGAYRRRNSGICVAFHDTHHRAITATDEIRRFELSEYDCVLAYGASLKHMYERCGWGKQVYVWHEAADVRTFFPRARSGEAGDIVWIGNWGDDERTEELREFFIEPVKRLSLSAHAYGVRYPDSAVRELADAQISYGGWRPNFEVPEIFSHFRATIHVPRRPYTRELPGIPTIRPFEALACGIPLVSAPWSDSEGLFRPGEDFVIAKNGTEMEQHLEAVIHDSDVAESLRANGLETIRSRHTCRHRVDELLEIYAQVAPALAEPAEVAS